MITIRRYQVDRNGGHVKMPWHARIIRAAHIKDGDFLWALVETKDECIHQTIAENSDWMDMIKFGEMPKITGTKHEIEDKQFQTIMLIGPPWAAQDFNEKMYIYHNNEGPIKDYTFAMFSEDELIPTDPARLKYLGMSRRRYTFLVL